MAVADIERIHAELRAQGAMLAGPAAALERRMAIYRELYIASHGNHGFALIAAHGVLWGRGHFRFGLWAGSWLARLSSLRPAVRRARLAMVRDFADAFYEINRIVCAEIWALTELTRRHRGDPQLSGLFPRRLLRLLNAAHAAAAAQQQLPYAERRALFEALVTWEQQSVVAPMVTRAVAAFDWPLGRALALRPRIALRYIPWHRRFVFRDFSSMGERIARGLQAFDLAEAVGWPRVLAALDAALPPQPSSQMPSWMAGAVACTFSGLSEKPASTSPTLAPASSRAT